jgi:type IV pilus assembly protein PilE
MMFNMRRQAGFTLIEVMVVVAIIAILAAIGYPAYTEQVARSRRADAKAALLEAAQWIEREFTVSGSYARMGDGSNLTNAELLAAPLQAMGATAQFYTIGFAAAPTARAFTINMVPTGAMVNDRCGTLSVDQSGARGVSGSGVTVAECWNK